MTEKNKTKTIRQLGMKDIWKNTPFNTTTTYFWAQLVFYGLKVDSSFTKLSSTSFNYFLLQNPSLSNNYKNLMNNYYSNKLMKQIKDETKRNEMILPDIMALPSLITDVEKIKDQQKKEEDLQEIKEFKRAMIGDSVFIKEFEDRSFKSWNHHISFLRVIWCYLNMAMSQQNILTKWKLFKKENYHETKAFFWIEMVKIYRIKYKQYIENKDKGKEKKENENKEKEEDQNENEEAQKLKTMKTFSFEGFLYFAEWKEFDIENEKLFDLYYTRNVIESDDASQKILKPDKKQFPQ